MERKSRFPSYGTERVVINKLISTAKKSSVNKKHAAAILDRKGRILCVAHNEKNNQNTNQTDSAGSHHAECMALAKLQRIRYTKKRDSARSIFVIRLNKAGELAYSKPCEACSSVLDKFNLQVYYS